MYTSYFWSAVGNGAQKEFSVCTGHNRGEALISNVCNCSVSFVIKTPTFLQDILVSAALYKIANQMSVCCPERPVFLSVTTHSFYLFAALKLRAVAMSVITYILQLLPTEVVY
jgi:hypothetical protein